MVEIVGFEKQERVFGDGWEWGIGSRIFVWIGFLEGTTLCTSVKELLELVKIFDFEEQEKALDEREQEDKHTADIWTYAIVIVVVLLIIRLGFRIIKKRRQKKP